MYIYHALIDALRAHMIHIKLNTIFYTHVEHSLPFNTKCCLIQFYAVFHNDCVRPTVLGGGFLSTFYFMSVHSKVILVGWRPWAL